MTPRRTTTIRIDDELIDGLQLLKDRDGVPVSEQVRRAIRMWLASKDVRVKTSRRPAPKRRKA